MKRFVWFLIGLCLMAGVLAGIDEEFGRLTYYAEEYEIGNIDYPRLVIGVASVREKLSEEFGAVSNFEGGILNQENIEKILGSPNEMTRWVWVEGEDKERKIDKEVGVWRRVVFDGNKIQIKLELYPSIFSKKKFVDHDMDYDFLKELEGEVVYRMHFNIEFKKQGESFDFEADVNEVGEMAEKFSENPNTDNAEKLAGKSVGIEKRFSEYLRQNEGKCEDIMVSFFGAENQRDNQKVVVWDIDFVEGSDFDSFFRLEMCEECEWNWIGLNLRIDSKNFHGNRDFKGEGFRIDPKEISEDEIKKEIKKAVDEVKVSLQQEDFDRAFELSNQLRVLNDVWNEISNNVWEKVGAEFEIREDLMSEKERMEFHENYGWIKLDQERKRAEKKLRQNNFVDRKQFYFDLFSGYEKRDSFFKEKSWEKRLFEDFVSVKREVCDNGKDDNEDGSVDCSDRMCGGAICGRVESGNVTVDLFCIESECRARDEMIVEEVCGNHICGLNETVDNCAQDCFACMKHEAIECDGRVVFGGEDENGCPLSPVCVEENSCEVDSDCEFLCGEGECIEGTCKVKELLGCEDGCLDGEENIVGCGQGEKIVVEFCDGGVWKATGLECEDEVIEEETQGDNLHGDECEVVSDCGGEDDVCSNGKCITLPEKIEEKPEEIIVEEIKEVDIPEEESEEIIVEETDEVDIPEESQEESSDGDVEIENGESGNVVFGFLNFLSNLKITGAAVGDDGFVSDDESAVEENIEDDGSGDEDVVEDGGDDIEESSGDSIVEEGLGPGDDSEEDFHDEEQERDRDDEERARREKDEEREHEKREREMKERCEMDCKRPCVEECIRDACGDDMDCDVDEESKDCEGECEPSEDCVKSCSEGGDWWREFEKDQVIENGVFNVGGSCRISDGRSEGNIWFDGWGQPFEEIRWLKEKYYNDGHDDWCKREFESSLQRRLEFEKGFNEEFVVWFFEKYLANSAEDWESAQSGIYELYWNNVDNLRRMAENMRCMDERVIDMKGYNLINVSYESEHGRLDFWEEVREVQLPGAPGKVTMISPYMKIWIFPPKEFIKFEMREAMKNGEFPGPSEEKMERGNEEGLTVEEKEKIMEDNGLMSDIEDVIERYDGNFGVAVEFKDGEETVFNLYAEVNEDDIFKMQPMLPEEVSDEDARVEVDFNLIYDFILSNEMEIRGEEIVSPPWDERDDKGFVMGIVDGIKMYFKIRNIVNSAEYFPEESEDDIKDLFWGISKVMMEGDEDRLGKKGEMLDKEGVGEMEEGDFGKFAGDEDVEGIFSGK